MKKSRAPIVTVLGHVDHGKTTLLDVIRDTNIAASEAGGITQSIGATKITTSFGPITFIDTPGHALFSEMRVRGVKIADLALLVVASDDGVMPQTVEALDYINKSGTPFVVVLTKTDLPSADPEKVISQLEERGVLFEGAGGDVPKVQVSAKAKKGIEGLLEIIHLVSEVHEISGDEEDPLEGVIVEMRKDKRGTLALAVIKKGVLEVGDEVDAGGVAARVKGLFDDKNKSVKKALPGEPILILGFSDLPDVGSVLKGFKGGVERVPKEKKVLGELSKGQVPLVVKAESSGGLQAILSSLPHEFMVLQAGVGDVTETDIFLAKSANASIFVFGSKVPPSVRKLADTEGVTIESFKIIYEFVDRLNEILDSQREVVLGKANIIKIFSYENRRVAGCRVEEGRINVKDANLVLRRNTKDVGKIKIVSMKKGKLNIQEAKAREEFGVILAPMLDFMEGDVIVSLKSQG